MHVKFPLPKNIPGNPCCVLRWRSRASCPRWRRGTGSLVAARRTHPCGTGGVALPPAWPYRGPLPTGWQRNVLKPLAGCCSHGGAAVPDPAHPNEYYFVLSHGYHYTGKPNWLDDTWVWSSRTKSWRMYGLRSMDWPHARYAIQLGQWALVPPLHVQL